MADDGRPRPRKPTIAERREARSTIEDPKIILDDGEVVWGCECWWGPEAGYASFRGTRVEKRCSIADERKALP